MPKMDPELKAILDALKSYLKRAPAQIHREAFARGRASAFAEIRAVAGGATEDALSAGPEGATVRKDRAYKPGTHWTQRLTPEEKKAHMAKIVASRKKNKKKREAAAEKLANGSPT